MNILYVHPHPDARHGSEIAMAREAVGMRQAGQRAFLLHGLTGACTSAKAYEGALSSPRLFPQNWRADLASLRAERRALAAFLEKAAIDLIHVHVLPRIGVLREWARLRPTVVTMHTPFCPSGGRYFYGTREVCERAVGLGCIATGYLEKRCACFVNGKRFGFLSFLKGLARHFRTRDALATCARVIAPSRAQQRRLVLDGLPAALVEVVNPTVQDEAAESFHPLPCVEPGPPAILFAGRLLEYKGADHLLRASARVKTPHRLWIAGEGPQQAALEQLATELRLASPITFFGSLDSTQLGPLRQHATLAVVPSLVRETFGMVGPEAMLHGLPVVAYDVGGIGDWLQDSVTGRLVCAGSIAGLAEAIDELLQDPARARALGEAGRAATSAWSPAAHTRAIENVYLRARETWTARV